MNIDPNTGLPELPEGHFWHVRKDLEGDHHISIRRGWHYLLSYKVEGGWIVNRPLTKDSLFEKTVHIYTKWTDRVGSIEESRKLVGSYPPKSLNK